MRHRASAACVVERMRVTGLTKRYSDLTALASINFAIVRGEILGLIGPNGSGKTTLLECLAGLLPADAGTVDWNRGTLPPQRRKAVMFYLPDGIAPYADRSVSSVLSFFGGAYRVPIARIVAAVDELALEPVLHKPVGALSKGYCRRLLLSVGLITPHPLLVMDEPFDFDLRQTRELMALLRRLTERGRTLLLAIHQLVDAERICDRFVLLVAGRVRSEGTLPVLRAAAGKRGRGLIPLADEPFTTSERYGSDRFFAYLELEGQHNTSPRQAMVALEQADRPVARISVKDIWHIGQEFFRWEIATAVAGAIIGIDPFDQPDVETSKDQTRALTEDYEKSHFGFRVGMIPTLAVCCAAGVVLFLLGATA